MATNYKEKAKNARLKILDMIFRAQTSHLGSNFSVIDIMAVLFENVDLKKDKIVLSAGWKAASLYYFLAQKGVFEKDELDTYCLEGSKLIGLTEPGIPGIEFAGGSMQMGFPAAVGFALAKKISREEGNVYCILSDGEIAGGMIWESVLIASHWKLNNLIVFVDYNQFQAMGPVANILNVAFPQMGFKIMHVNGHDHGALEKAMNIAKTNFQGPLCFICSTIKGKGVKSMENNNIYHYKAPSKEEYQAAKMELLNG